MPTLQTYTRPADPFGARAAASQASAPAHQERDAPYSRQVVGGWRDANGTLVRIRPIASADAELIREFVRSLSLETRYLRFMTAVNELSPQMVDRLTGIDHRRDAALIAVVGDGGVECVVAVARYALDVDGESCDFAIVVADDWQGHGLGRRLLTLLIETAAARGLKRIAGDVLAVNRPMLAFVRALRFEVSASDDPTVRRVDLGLDRPGSAV